MSRLKEIFDKNKKAVIALLVAAVVYGGYSFFSSGDSAELSLDFSPAVSGYDTATGQSILRTLNELRRIRLDVTIFDNPVFKSLVDHKVATTTLPLGRIDPFAPNRLEK